MKANFSVVADGKLTGEVGEPIVDAAAKRDALVACAANSGLERDDVWRSGMVPTTCR